MTSSDKPTNLIDLTTAAKRKKAKRKAMENRAGGVTLCKRGFHKWVDDPKKQFDVKQGKLISIRRCSRCGKRQSQTG